jgi:hypothetical protein
LKVISFSCFKVFSPGYPELVKNVYIIQDAAFAAVYDESFHPRCCGDSRQDLSAFRRMEFSMFSRNRSWFSSKVSDKVAT